MNRDMKHIQGLKNVHIKSDVHANLDKTLIDIAKYAWIEEMKMPDSCMYAHSRLKIMIGSIHM